MIICIPTLNKPGALTSLELANKIVGEENVYVFFHDETDMKAYKKNYIIKNAVVTGLPRGIAAQRNAILNQFPEDTEMVMMDDDIKNFLRLRGTELVAITPEQSLNELQNCFQTLKNNQAKLFGLYPIKNPFYMSPRINNKGFIIGTVMGIINNPLRFDENLHTKEDYDYTLQNIRVYKKVARFDYLTTDAAHDTMGGCEYAKRSPQYSKDTDYLLKKWGTWLRPNPRRTNEVLINLRKR
jgi:hypothetical protein